MSPKISIVIACLNCSRTLRKCLESIREQSYLNKEIVLIDALSSDETLNIVREYEESIDYWESSADTGIYHAWNKALAHVNGEWVIFLGADDYFTQMTF